MMLQMLAVFAEFEHATIVDRISAGIERRAKEGRWFGGRPPFGYTFSSEERVLVPDPVKAPVVQRVFYLYARKRLGTRTIAQQLREEGAPAPSAGWGHPGVHWIINNPTYVGKIRCVNAANTQSGAVTPPTSSFPAYYAAAAAGSPTSA